MCVSGFQMCFVGLSSQHYAASALSCCGHVLSKASLDIWERLPLLRQHAVIKSLLRPCAATAAADACELAAAAVCLSHPAHPLLNQHVVSEWTSQLVSVQSTASNSHHHVYRKPVVHVICSDMTQLMWLLYDGPACYLAIVAVPFFQIVFLSLQRFLQESWCTKQGESCKRMCPKNI